MKFEVNASFDWCAIFHGKINSPMACRLSLDKSYSLIYIDISAGLAKKDNIDFFALINQAFATGLPEDLLYIQDAGFYTFSNSSSTSEKKTIAEVFPDNRLPEVVARASTVIPDSTSLWLTVRLKGEMVFGSLLQIGINDGGQPAVNDISLSGVLDNTKAIKEAITTGTYSATLPDFRLFTLFDFTGLTLGYQFDKSACYTLFGKLAFTLFEHRYQFLGQLRYQDKVLQACLMLDTSSPTTTVPSLFDGAMKGVSFSDLIFALHYTLASDDGKTPAVGLFRVQGKINYGPQGGEKTPVFSGQIYLQGLTPVLAAVSIDSDIDIHAIFSQSIPGASWPDASLINLVIKKDSSLYYQNEATGKAIQEVDFYCPVSGDPSPLVPGTVVYEPGFHIHALFDVTLIKTLSIIGDVAIDSKGVRAAIQLATPVDIFIVQITAINNRLAGPEFNFSSQDSTMGFRGGLWFFQQDFGLNVSIAGKKGADNTLSISGSLTSTKAFPPMFPSPPSLGFSYSKEKGFAVTNWPDFSLASPLIDIAEGLKKLSQSKGSGCGAIGNLISDNIKTEFTLTPGFVTPKAVDESSQLSLSLTGSYEIFALGQSIGTIVFPRPVLFPVANNLSMDKLGEAIINALAGAAESLAEGLADNAKAIAVYLAVTGGAAAASYAATLACQGAVNAVVTAATSAAAEALAAGAGIIAAIGAAGGAVDRSCFVAGTQVLLASGESRGIETIRPGDRLRAGNGDINTVLGLETPPLGARALYGFNRSGRYFVTAEHPLMTRTGWRAIDPHATRRENTSLRVERLQPGDRLVRWDLPDLLIRNIDSQQADSATTLYNLLLDGDHTYYADSILVHNKDPKPPGPPRNPDMPEGVNVRTTAADCVFAWASTSYAQGYKVSLNGPDGKPLLNKDLDYAGLSVSAPLSLFTTPGLYTWQVAAVRGSFVSAFNPLGVRRLGAMAMQLSVSNLRSRDVAARVQWTSVEGASDAGIRVESAGSAPVDHSEPLTAPYWDYRFADNPAGEYAFRLQATGGNDTLPGAWSTPQILQRLASPDSLTASWNGEAILADWPPLAGISGYLLSLYAPDGTLVSQSDGDSSGTLTLPLALPIAQGSYRLWICSMPDSAAPGDRVPGKWVAAPDLPVQLDATQWAALAFRQHLSATVCASQLLAAFSTLSATPMAVAMAKAGYLAADTAQGLMAAFPTLTATEMAAALLAAYGSAADLDQIAAEAFREHKSGADCAALMLDAWPQTPPLALGKAMAKAGYDPAATAQGLKVGYPTLTATALVALLTEIYGKNEG